MKAENPDGYEPNKPEPDIARIWQPLPDPNCPKCGGAGECFVRLPDRVGSPQKRECDCMKTEINLCPECRGTGMGRFNHNCKAPCDTCKGTGIKTDERLLADEGIDKVWRETERKLGFPNAEPVDDRGLPNYASGKAHLDAVVAACDAECQKRVDRMFARTLDIDTQTLQKVYDAHEKEMEEFIREIESFCPIIKEGMYGDIWQSLRARYLKPPK